MSFNTIEFITQEFHSVLKSNWIAAFGNQKHDYLDLLLLASSVALELTSRTDAVFHNVEFVLQVTCVGQALLKGKLIKEGNVTPDIWLHVTLATLFCNIGMIRGILKSDNIKRNIYSTGVDNQFFTVPEGGTDAALCAHTVTRSQRFLDEYYGNHPIIRADEVKRHLELKVFPIPNPCECINGDYPSLVRAAILVGEIADTRWFQRLAQLYYEYRENGVTSLLGYSSPGDLKKTYPAHFWSNIHPCISPCIPYLEATQNGQTILSLSFANVFTLEHSRQKSNVIGFGLQAIIDPIDQEKLSQYALK